MCYYIRMATQTLVLTQTPQEITGLSAGERYAGQNVDPVGRAYLANVSGNSAPAGAALQTRNEIAPDQGFSLIPQSGESIWAWSNRAQCRIVYDDQAVS